MAIQNTSPIVQLAGKMRIVLAVMEMANPNSVFVVAALFKTNGVLKHGCVKSVLIATILLASWVALNACFALTFVPDAMRSVIFHSRRLSTKK
jgi:hypothetical protein